MLKLDKGKRILDYYKKIKMVSKTQIKNKNKDKSNKALIEFKREMTEIINEIEQAFL